MYDERCYSCESPICGGCGKHLRFYRGRVPVAVIAKHGIKEADALADTMCRCDEGGGKSVVHVRGEENQV